MRCACNELPRQTVDRAAPHGGSAPMINNDAPNVYGEHVDRAQRGPSPHARPWRRNPGGRVDLSVMLSVDLITDLLVSRQGSGQRGLSGLASSSVSSVSSISSSAARKAATQFGTRLDP